MIKTGIVIGRSENDYFSENFDENQNCKNQQLVKELKARIAVVEVDQSKLMEAMNLFAITMEKACMPSLQEQGIRKGV